MFDPKKYDTRMRDPGGKRKKPPVEERTHDLPSEGTLRKRTTERFDEKRAEEPLRKLKKERTRRPMTWRWGPVVSLALVALIIWRFAAGAVGQAIVLIVVGGVARFFAATRRASTAPRSTSTARPPPLPRLRTRRRATTAAPKPPPRPKMREAKPKKTSAWGVIASMSLIATLGGVATRACKPDRTRTVTHHYETSRREPVQPRAPGRTEAPDWRTQLPPATAQRISGAVLFGGRILVGPVELTLTPKGGAALTGWTDNRGIFVFDRVRAEGASVEVVGNVHLGAAPRDIRLFPAGTRTGVIDLDPRHTFLLQRQGNRGVERGMSASIQVAATSGSSSGRGTWRLDHKTVIVSGLAPDDAYDVLVRAPEARLAGIAERVGPGQRILVTLGRSASLHGMVMLPPHVSKENVQILLTHGPLRITGTVNGLGLWRIPNLPRYSWWDVTARHVTPSGAHEAKRSAMHAGDTETIVLDLR